MNCNDASFKRCRPAPEPNSPCRPRPPYLMQRILASGQTHRRCADYPVCLDALPSTADGPFTVTEAFLCGPPQWQEENECCRSGLSLCVTLPVCLRVCDGRGNRYTLPIQIEEPLRLRFDAPPQECWRGSVDIQAAVRLASRCGRLERGCVTLEVLIQGFLLCPCPLGERNACRPDPRPWYPQPIRENFWES